MECGRRLSTGVVLAALLGGEEEDLDDLEELADLLGAQNTVADHVQRLVDALNAHHHHFRICLLLHRIHERLKQMVEQANGLAVVLQKNTRLAPIQRIR